MFTAAQTSLCPGATAGFGAQRSAESRCYGGFVVLILLVGLP